MTTREIPIEALFGDVVEASELSPLLPASNLARPRVAQTTTRIDMCSGRWLLCNLNTGTLKAYERTGA
jgi:hypothetical protein